MKETIWKFVIKTQDEQTIQLPSGYEILTVQNQQGVPCLWVKVNPSNDLENVELIIHGTGHPCADNIEYIGTYQKHDGQLVFHVFKKIEDAKHN